MTKNPKPANKVRVLYVEDQHGQRTAFAKLLRSKQMVVKAVASGKEAVAAFKPAAYDVVLCDLNMPRMNGLQVLSKLQKIDSQTPLIILTANGAVDAAVAALKQGAFDFVLKPLEINTIANTIYQAIEKKRLQNKLAESESSLQMLIDTVPDIVYSLNARGEFISVNPAGQVLLGYRPQEFVGASVFDYIYPEDRDRVRRGFEAAMKNGDHSIKTLEFRMVCKSGEVKDFEVNRRLIFDNGRVLRQDGIARDVTSRNLLKKEMQKHSRELEEVVEQRTKSLEYATRQLAALNAVSNRFTQIYDENELMEKVPEFLTYTLDFDRAVLSLEKDGKLEVRSFCFAKDPPELVQRFLNNFKREDFKLPPHFWESFNENKTIFVPDLNADPRWPREEGKSVRTRAMVIAPIRLNKKPIGLITGNMHYHERAMDAQDVARFEMFANMVGLALENIRVYQNLEKKVIERTRSLRAANKEMRDKAQQLEKSTYSLARSNVQLLAAQEELEKKNQEMAELLKHLSESEAKTSALLNAIPDLMFQIDRDGFILDYKDSGSMGLYVPPEMFMNKKLDDIFSKDLGQQTLSFVETALATRRIQVFEYQLPFDETVHDYEARMVVSGEDRVLVIVRDITIRKAAEEALRRERNFVATVLDTAGALVTVLDIKGRIIRFNRACEDTSGYSFEEVKDKEFWDIFLLPEEIPGVEAVFENLLAGDFPNNHDNYWVTKNGGRRLISWSNTCLVNSNKKVEYIVATGIDVTDRKEAEARLATRLQYEKGLAACSKTLLEGREDDTALDRALRHLLVAADVGRVYVFENFDDPNDGLCMRQLNEICAPGIKPEIDNPILQHVPYKDGFVRWRETLSRGEPINGKTSTFPHSERELLEAQGIQSILVLPILVASRWIGFIGFDDVLRARDWGAEDIRLLQTAAEMVGGYIEHKRAEESLKESEERFRSLVENANDIIYSLTPEGVFVYASPNWTDILGHDVSEVVGRHFAPFVHPDDLDVCATFLRRVIETGEKQSGVEYRVQHKDGSWRWHTSSASVLKDPDGQVTYFVGIAHDITERKKFLDELAEANRHLIQAQAQLVQSEKMASLGMLVAGIAHEINTPIGAIHSMHDTLKRALDKLKSALQNQFPTEFQANRSLHGPVKIIEDATKVIDSGSERVTNIVRRLRSFARLDEAEIKTADIHDGIEDTLTLICHETKHNISIVKNYGELPPISCFPGRLNQVFLNILINARQAIEGKGTISITTYRRDNKVHVEFKDSGKGISKEHLHKIFDPGFTTKGVGVGTGLGLSIVYQIVQDHHGEIKVDSEPGKGATFTVILPMNLEEILEVS
jgi:PAS domain S-box-containing protein